MLTAEGRLEEEFEVSSATNNLPEICGRICPQDRLCEGNCVIEKSGYGTVNIGSVKKYITDTAFEPGWVKPVSPPRELNLSVGIIGGKLFTSGQAGERFAVRNSVAEVVVKGCGSKRLGIHDQWHYRHTGPGR